MNQATFYILDKESNYDRYLFACRLIEKAIDQNMSIALVTPAIIAQEINNLLWSFKPESFIPHDVLNLSGDESLKIISIPSPADISTSPALEQYHLSINLMDAPHSPPINSERHIEIAIRNKDMLKLLRQAYKNYLNQSISVEVHDFTKKKQ